MRAMIFKCRIILCIFIYILCSVGGMAYGKGGSIVGAYSICVDVDVPINKPFDNGSYNSYGKIYSNDCKMLYVLENNSAYIIFPDGRIDTLKWSKEEELYILRNSLKEYAGSFYKDSYHTALYMKALTGGMSCVARGWSVDSVVCDGSIEIPTDSVVKCIEEYAKTRGGDYSVHSGLIDDNSVLRYYADNCNSARSPIDFDGTSTKGRFVYLVDNKKECVKIIHLGWNVFAKRNDIVGIENKTFEQIRRYLAEIKQIRNNNKVREYPL